MKFIRFICVTSKAYLMRLSAIIIIKKLENIWLSRFLLRNLRCVKSAMIVSVTKTIR